MAADSKGLVGHPGVVLLRRIADRVGSTGELATALPVSAARVYGRARVDLLRKRILLA
ncbi:hypothetical protein [Glycomyces salinus]|uniref:hypothetical protein n=1 Tax=Glycomyces salinus TaxID=980294 RepID=UPI0018EAA6A6|nr:hypothetical protein [Glycomyces salinus]